MADACMAGLYTWLELAVHDSSMQADVLLMQDLCFGSKTVSQCYDTALTNNLDEGISARSAEPPESSEAQAPDHDIDLNTESHKDTPSKMDPDNLHRAMQSDAIGGLSL